MTDLGEILNNSTLFLELLTKDELGQSIWADDIPEAVITTSDGLSVIEVANVKLNEMSNIGEYSYSLEIPLNWKDGRYGITYHTTINGAELTLQESFTLIIAEVEPEDFAIVENDEVEFGDKDAYLFSSDYQTACTIAVDGSTITLTPVDVLKSNHTYTLVLTKHMQSETKEKVMGEMQHISFTSVYSPLYATPLEVRAEIKQFFPYFDIDDVYGALRDAGEKAHLRKGLIPDANNSRFKLATERDDYYFPLTKYVVYEASVKLMTRLLLRMLQGEGTSDDPIGFSGGSGASFTLGDFSVDDKQSGSAGAGAAGINRTLLEAFIKNLEKELKFWQDSMMGHNNRSYAKPASTGFRTDVGAPGSRDL